MDVRAKKERGDDPLTAVDGGSCYDHPGTGLEPGARPRRRITRRWWSTEQRRLAQRRRCSAVGRFAISPQCFPARVSAKHAEFGKLASEWEPPEHQSACHAT